MVHVDAPSWYTNPDFKFIFTERTSLDSIADATPLSFPPQLSSTLTSPEPPPFSFFLGLPSASPGQWGVYACCLEKEGEAPLLYIGSGTNASTGLLGRTNAYKPDSTQLPRFVAQAFKKGYTLTHIGVLCWTDMPVAGLQPRARGFIMAVEAAFSVIFHAVIPMITDSYIEHLWFWPRSSVEWKPLCSHLCLNEAIRGDLTKTSEELEVVAAIRAARMLENANERSRKYRANKRAKDLDGYRAHDRKVKSKWTSKNRDKVTKTAAKVRSKNIDTDRFHCNDCDMSLQSRFALEQHNRTQDHHDRVAGIVKPPPSASAVQVKAGRAKAKANDDHRCFTCNKSFQTDWSLTRHNGQEGHAKKLQASRK